MIDKPFFNPRIRCICVSDAASPCGCVLAKVFMKDGILSTNFGISLDVLLSGEGRFVLHVTDPSRGCLDALCSRIGQAGISGRVLVFSAHAEAVKRVRRSAGSCATALTSGEALAVLLLSKMGLLFLRRRFAGDALLVSESAGGVRLLNAQLAKELRERGVRVFAWGVTDSVRAKRLLDAGVEGVISSDAWVIKETV